MTEGPGPGPGVSEASYLSKPRAWSSSLITRHRLCPERRGSRPTHAATLRGRSRVRPEPLLFLRGELPPDNGGGTPESLDPGSAARVLAARTLALLGGGLWVRTLHGAAAAAGAPLGKGACRCYDT